MLLVADSAATVLYFGCSAINTPKLVELTADGKFAFQGTYYPPTPGPVARKPGVADVMGKVQGNTVVLTYDVLGDGQGEQGISLHKGVEPPIDFPCPLLNVSP